MDGLGGLRFRRRQAIQVRVDQFLLLREVVAKVHAFSGRIRLGLDFAFFADEHFDAGFGLFQLLAAGVAEAHAFFEEFQGALQGEIAGLQFLDDLFQFVEAGLEGEDGAGGAVESATHYCNQWRPPSQGGTGFSLS
jgi:hypothetical protein